MTYSMTGCYSTKPICRQYSVIIAFVFNKLFKRSSTTDPVLIVGNIPFEFNLVLVS